MDPATTLRKHLAQDLALGKGARLAVAFSGGADSTALLWATAAVARTAGYRLRALHVDHGLHRDARLWARHSARLAAHLGVPLSVLRVRVTEAKSLGVEGAARKARYAALAHALFPGETLLLAHHADDQAETVLLALLRGAGVEGLSAMPVIAPLGQGIMARPFLEIPRSSLQRIVSAEGIRAVADPANRDERNARSFLRHRILPLLESRFGDVAQRLARTSHAAQAMAALAAEMAQCDLATCEDAHARLCVPALRALSVTRQRNVLRYWIRHRSGAMPSAPWLEESLRMVTSEPRSHGARARSGAFEVRRYRDHLECGRVVMPWPAAYAATWDDLGVPLPLPDHRTWRAEAASGAGASHASLEGRRLIVRGRQGGEVMRVKGHRHPLKKLLQEAGMPPWERSRVPVLYADGRLVAVGDTLVDDEFRAAPGERGVRFVLPNP